MSWIKNLTQWWIQSGSFFPNSGNFFWFSKMAWDTSPLFPSFTPGSVAKYALIFMNMPIYPLKSLNKLFWPCQGSEHAWSSYMFDMLLKMPLVLNKPRFWIWHSSICNSYAEFWIVCIGVSTPSSKTTSPFSYQAPLPSSLKSAKWPSLPPPPFPGNSPNILVYHKALRNIKVFHPSSHPTFKI